jgi:hypothetical protein
MLLKWNRATLLVAIALVALGVHTHAQAVEKEPVAVLELGAAGNWNVRDGSGSVGPDLAVEVTPIQKLTGVGSRCNAAFRASFN